MYLLIYLGTYRTSRVKFSCLSFVWSTEQWSCEHKIDVPDWLPQLVRYNNTNHIRRCQPTCHPHPNQHVGPRHPTLPPRHDALLRQGSHHGHFWMAIHPPNAFAVTIPPVALHGKWITADLKKESRETIFGSVQSRVRKFLDIYL